MPRIITLATAIALLASCEDPVRVTRTPHVAQNVVGANVMLVPTIAFTSTRDDPTASPFLAAEIYLMDADFKNQRRLTVNNDGDAFAILSPDGKKIVFDSNRLRGTGPLNTSDLFVMNTDGTQQTFLVHGGSPTWSPDGKNIAFHASASGTAPPLIGTPGAATTDSDIFLLNVDDALAGVGSRINITNNASAIDDDPDWSPDGMKIVFTSHSVNEPNHNNAVSAELYIMNADGTGTPTRLTFNGEEERAPAWSPDGMRIAYSCRIGGLDSEICVLTFNQDGTTIIQQLTDNTVPDLTVSWSGDGQTLLFHRSVAGLDQLFSMKADGSEAAVQKTMPPGRNLLARWGVLRVKSG
jgi:TolB protein